MKVAILGGASFSTPALFAAMNGEFADCEFVLVARSSDNLQRVVRASQVVAGAQAPRMTPFPSTPLSCGPALEGAAVVIVQMRIGNLPGRAFDESFPLDYDLCGDEGLGAGGMSAAWRSWPALEPWLEAIQRHTPQALVLMMTSPVGILTRATSLRFPKLNCLGICEVPFVALRALCTRCQTDIDSISFDYFGVNHIGWLYDVTLRERDLVREWAEARDGEGFPAASLINEWGGVPTKYLRLHFEAEAALAVQRGMPLSRALELETLQRSALASYATASEKQVRETLGRRDMPWYGDSIVPLLRGLNQGEAAGPFFLSGPNRGWTDACWDDDIIEIGCRVQQGCIVRIAQKQRPPLRITELIWSFCRHEKLATLAVLERSPRMMADALRRHPWVARAGTSSGRDALAAALAESIVGGNQRMGFQ